MTFAKTTTLALVAGALAIAQIKPVVNYHDIKYPPLHEVKVPQPTKFELPNGMTVFLLEDHELPTISMQALVRTGGRYVSPDKAGLAAIQGTVMRTGGTETHKGDDIDAQLDVMGASLESFVGRDSGSVNAFSLKEDFGKVLPLFSDVLRNPSFPQDKIDLAKTAQRDSISRRNENHMGIFGREIGRVIYGKNSPYALETEYDTINSITRDDLIAFHKRFYQPENVILGVWGDFNSADMKAEITQEFGNWAKGGNPVPAIPAVEDAAKTRGGIYAINKDDINQSVVALGALGGKINDPDYAANELLSVILGGGEFGSRMLDNIRSKAGLAYATGSSWRGEYDHPGTYIAYVATKSNTTMQALDLMKKEVTHMAEGEVTDKELQYAKDYVLKGQAFDFDSTSKIIGRLMTYQYYGYPSNFLQLYTDAIKKTTKADIARAAKQYWNPDKMVVLVLGKTSDFDKPLSSLGNVQMIDISIPKPKSEKVAAATSETLEAGNKLLAKVRAAYGGDKLATVKDYRGKAEMTMTTPQGEMTMKVDELVMLSGKSLQKMQTPMGEVIQAFDGQKVWVKTPQGVQELPAAAATAAKASEFHETIPLLLAKDTKVQALGPLKFAGKDAEALLITDASGKNEVKLYVDPATGLLLGKSYEGGMMGGPGQIQEVYTDYMDVNGIKFPSHVIINQNDQKRGEVKASEYKVNTGAQDSEFAKP